MAINGRDADKGFILVAATEIRYGLTGAIISKGVS